MKCSSMMAVAFCGVLAFALTGCKYDDAAEGDVSASTEVGTNAGDADALAAGQDVNSDLGKLEGEDGVPATGLPFDQDPNYTRCFDVDFVPVYFSLDASNIASSEMAKIEAVAQHLKDKPERVVMVEGNCDERGSNEYNMSLGQFRAEAIQKYLVQLGIDAARIQTKSYGEEKPAVRGSGEGAWSKNRRGEFAVFVHK